MNMLKFSRKRWSFFKLLLLPFIIINIFTSLTPYFKNNKKILPVTKQGNLQMFYQSFLDKSQPLCNSSFLDKKKYVSRHCQLKSYEIVDVVKCLDLLSASVTAKKDDETINRSIDQSILSGRAAIARIPEANRKLTHFLFIGDSRIRGIFCDFIRLLPNYDLEYDPPIGPDIQKIHTALNVTSQILNLRASFYWEPTFSNTTKTTFMNWVHSFQTGTIKVIVAGITLHHIVQLLEDISYYVTYKSGLTEIEPVLRRLANETKVIWLKQYTVIDDPFIASIFYNHMSNLISIKGSIRNFNLLSESILRNSGVIKWDTGDFMVEEYLRSCYIHQRNDLEYTGKAYFSCPDLVHPGYVAQFYALQLFFNEMCYETLFH